MFSARGFVWFAAGPGESELHLIADPSQADHSPRHACLITDRLDELTARLRDAGYEVERHNGIVGRPQTFLRDPFGNLLELSRLLADYA